MIFSKDRYTQAETRDMCNSAYHDGELAALKANEQEIAQLKSVHQIGINELEAKHKIALREKEFEINHKNDDDKLKLANEKAELEKQLAVANETIKQLDRIVDLNADVLDVKALVNKLVDKLPTMNITSLNLPATTKTE